METTKLTQQMKLLRKSNNYTQKYVSEYLHITRSAYSNYERGSRTPSYEIISSLSVLYQISPNTFYSDTAYQFSSYSKEDENFLKLLHSLPHQAQEEVLDFILFKKERYKS